MPSICCCDENSAQNNRCTLLSNLKTARQKGKIEEFIKKHEADPEGDLDKLDAVIKRPTQESGKEAPKASSRVSDDD